MNLKPFNEIYNCDSITLNLTDACNLNCIYCFEHCKNASSMDPQVGIDIIDKAYRELDTKVTGSKFMLNFFGGEPFLNWNTMKAIIDHCNEKKYKILYGVTTNLTILNDEIIDYIDDNNMHLLVSADGLKSVHNKNRCNTFDIVIKNLKKLIEAELGLFVEIRMTIMPEDISKAIDGVKMFLQMGFDNICPMPVTDTYWSKEHILELETFYGDLMELYVKLLNQTNSTRNFAIKNTDEILTNVLEPEIFIPYMCPIGGTRWCAFDTNGDIYPCHQIPTSTDETRLQQKLGNIYTGVDESKIITQKREAQYIKPECDTCIAKAVCASGCPQENLRETGNDATPYDSYCNVQKAMVTAVRKYQKDIMNSKNIRNRRINLLIENMKIKEYIDTEFVKDSIKTKLEMTVKLMHINEMIQALGEENIFPSFGDYFNNKLIEVSASFLENQGTEYLCLNPDIY